MEGQGTLLLTRKEVTSLLTMQECIMAVEEVFRSYAEEQVPGPKVLGIHTGQGGFHIKAGTLGASGSYFVAKLNANFPSNPKEHGLPVIQGVIVVFDVNNGRLLALMDSMEITIIRTGAATAVAAKYLSSPGSGTVTICGCGNQGQISLVALMKVRKLSKAYAFDLDPERAHVFARRFAADLSIVPISAKDLREALKKSQIVVTCTPSRTPYIHAEDIQPGTFIAAVGADSENKQELYPDLLAASKVVTDLTAQCALFGDLHHAIDKGVISTGNVYCELGSVIAGKKPGRESASEVIVFDSTGTALQDIAAAAIVYEKARARNRGHYLDLGDISQAGGGISDPNYNQRDSDSLRSWFPFH